MSTPRGLPGGANIALTTSEQIVDLSALGGYEVSMACTSQDWSFSFAPSSETAAGPLVASAQAASLSVYVADPVGATVKIAREVSQPFTKLIVKCGASTGTLVIKPIRKV